LGKFKNHYATDVEKKQAKSLSSVDIDVDKEEILQPGEKSAETVEIKENKSPSESGDASGTATVKTSNLKTVGQGATDSAVDQALKTENKPLESKTVELKPDPPEAIEAAEQATKQIDKFSTNSEVIQALEIADTASLDSIPMYSLANRIKKFFFKKGFIAGFIVNQKDKSGGDDSEKVKRAEKVIRTMKIVNRILTRTCRHGVSDFEVGNTVAEVFCNNGKITQEEFDSLFTDSDVKDDEMLGKIKVAIGEKQDR